MVENYPELKANENFIYLQDELSGSENRVATARKDYNEAVQLYNVEVQTFPGNIFAGMMGFAPKEQFQECLALKRQNILRLRPNHKPFRQ